MKVRVYVTLKPGVLDPQGKAVASGLSMLGFSEVRDVRVGRFFDLEVESADRVEEMCRKLLANPVVEDFRVEAR